MKYKVGEKIRVHQMSGSNCWSEVVDQEAIIYEISGNTIRFRCSKGKDAGNVCSHEIDSKREDGKPIINKLRGSIKDMDLKSKFAGLFLQEPEKSFRRAGVTDSDGVLTDEGQEVFLSWLLKKNGDAFKTEVVDPILAAEKENEDK